MNETISKDNVTITVKDRSAYMDYSVYTVNLKMMDQILYY